MELQQLRYFLEVAHTQHITQSAEKLHIAQPALSQCIHRLENELGVKLFAQKGRNIVLTQYGKYFQSKVEGVVNTLDSLPEQLQIMAKTNYQTIHLKVLAATTLMTQAIIEYGNIHDDVKFQLLQNTDSDAFDIEITTEMTYQPTDNPNQIACPEKIYLAVPNNDKYKNITSISLENVADESFISLMGSKQFRYICDKYCHRSGIVPKIIFESDSPEAVKNMIAANLGIGFWPEFTWGKVETDKVKLLEISNTDCHRSIVITRTANDNVNVNNFFDFLKSKMLYRQ